jgi:hypothetical protein
MPRIEREPLKKEAIVELKKADLVSPQQKKEYEKRTGKKDAFSVKMKPVGKPVKFITEAPPQQLMGGISALQGGVLKKLDPKTIGELDIKKGQALQAEAKELRARADSCDAKGDEILSTAGGDMAKRNVGSMLKKIAEGYRTSADKLEAAGKALEETGRKILETGELPKPDVTAFEKTINEVWIKASAEIER